MDPSINSQSFWKIPFIKELIEESAEKIPIIIMLETWLKSHTTDAQINIPHYQIVRSDRLKRERGGAIIYLHEDLPISNEKCFDNGTCEIAICQIPTSKLIIASIYRPPDTSKELFQSSIEFLQKYIDSTSHGEHYDTLIFGDLNLPCINWNDITIMKNFNKITTECAKIFFTFMEKNLLSQYVDVPTRGKNILDLMLTNNSNLVSHVQSEETKLSDHNIISIYPRYSISQESKPPITKTPEPHSFRALNLRKCDFTKVKNHLNGIKWDDLYQICSPEEFPELLKLTILQICELYTPVKKPPNLQSSRCPHERKILKRKRKKLRNKIQKVKNSLSVDNNLLKKLHERLNDIYKQIQDSIKNQNLKEEQHAVDAIKKNPKVFYSHAKRFTKQRTNIGPLLDKENNLQQDPKIMADLLQNQYESVFSDPHSSNIKNTATHNMDWEPITDFQFTQKDIIQAIGEIGNNSACGEKDIPAIVLKSCKEELSYPIWKIWRESLDTGVIPALFKNQYITPIHKKSSRAVPSNYRPISLTSHIIKTFERIFVKNLVEYIENHQIIKSTQHAFCRGRSCLTQLISHVEDILQNLLRNNDTDAIYLDYAKAFDKVDHNLLLMKLHSYGIRGKLHDWLTAYLQNRSQFVVVNGEKSYPAEVKSGVPQGSVLGPLLFILYLNDLHSYINHSTVRSFADDTRILKEFKNTNDINLLQEDLNASINWSLQNNMLLHTDKFEYLCHSSGTSKLLQQLPFTTQYFQYTTGNGTQLNPIQLTTDLGVHIDSDLSWSPHISMMCDGARKKLSWVLSVFKDRSKNVMLCLYKSLIRSKLEYCCPLWDPTNMEDIIKIESVQRHFTSKVKNLSDLHYWERLKILKLMSLQRRRERYSIIHIFKILNDLTPNELQLHFYVSDRRGYKVKLPPIPKQSKQKHLSKYYSSFTIRASKLWNHLPAEITVIQSMDKFKSSLGSYLDTIPDHPPLHDECTKNSILDYNFKDRTGGHLGETRW